MADQIRKCTAQELHEALAAGSECQLVDVREFSEYETERVAGASLVPLSTLDKSLAGFHPERPVYLICRTGRRAAQAAEQLAKRGFVDLRLIDGGLQGWEAAGLPIERGEGRVWSLERQVRFVAGTLVLSGVLLSLLSPWFLLISGFVGAGLAFSAITDTCGMGMMLARMPWNQKRQAQSGGAYASS